MIKVFDTNFLINNIIDDENFYIPSTVLEEIESIKNNKTKSDDVRYKARKVAHWLRDNDDKYHVIICNSKIDDIITAALLPITPDNRICAAAKYIKDYVDNDVVFYTGDINCANIAKHVFGLDVETTQDAQDNIYKGYKLICGNTDFINSKLSSIDDWCVNEYAVIQNTDDNSESEMRFDGEKFVALKLPPSRFIKGRNALQRCALDMLMNPDIAICAVLGGYGSGKSMLTMKMSLFHVQEKGNQSVINIVREPKGEGESVGWLKGTFEEKTDQFFLPLAQQLEGGEFELESLKQRGILEAHIPYYCKGLTFKDSIVVVDEAEDLDEKQIRLIGTRLGENSRIFLNGDYKQSLINTTENNALIKMCNSLKGNKMFATVYLGEDVRSTASKIFSHIFE